MKHKQTEQVNKQGQFLSNLGEPDQEYFQALDFCLPEGFNRNELLDELGSVNHGWSNPNAVPTAMAVLALVKQITRYKRLSHSAKRTDVFAELSNKNLQSLISNLRGLLKPTLTAMEKLNWIEVNHSYKVGETSKGYRIGSRFNDSQWNTLAWEDALQEHVPELFENTPLGKKRKSYLNRWSKASSIVRTWEHLDEGPIKNVCQRTLDVLQFLTIPHYEKLIERIKTRPYRTKQGKPATEKTRAAYLAMVESIKDKNFFVHCHDDSKPRHTNRLFTNWTSTKKDFRPFFRFKGKPLIGVDIKACQVALLYKFYGDDPAFKDEKERFSKTVTQSDIYLDLGAEMAKVTGKPMLSRDEIKSLCFVLMFARNYHIPWVIRYPFCSLFPLLYRRISQHKWRFGHQAVAREMQLAESKIMVEGALHELLVEKGIDCLSVHDSIYCTEEHVDVVKQSMHKWFTREMGFVPQLDVTFLVEDGSVGPLQVKSGNGQAQAPVMLAA